MRDFKKATFATACFILILYVISIIIVLPWANSNSVYYLDSENRSTISGKLDCIISGASHGLTAFMPEIIDRELSMNSYNLSGTLLTMESRTFLLKKEIERNPVETVILEVSYNALTRGYETNHAEGEFPIIFRLDTTAEQIDYMTKHLKFDEYLDVYSRALLTGILHYRAIILNKNVSKIDPLTKGYYEKKQNNVRLLDDEVSSVYNSESISVDNIEENVAELEKQISICKEKGCRVMIVVTPISDAMIWRTNNFDEFSNWLKAFCKAKGCEFYDFNLLKERYNLFFDNESFSDNTHLSKCGASKFSVKFSEIITKIDNGKDVSGLFYETYNEAKKYSPYVQKNSYEK